MNSAYHPSCFDSSFWGKLCRYRAKMGRKIKKENHNGIGKLNSYATRPHQPPIYMSLPTVRKELFPSLPFNLGQSISQKPESINCRPLFGNGFYQTDSWIGYRQPVTISVDSKIIQPVRQPIMNPAHQCLSDINRVSFVPVEVVKTPMFPFMMEQSRNRAQGSPLAPGTPRVSPRDQRRHYSRKVFVGGLPPDVTAKSLIDSFSKFGVLDVGWPRKAESLSISPPKGFAFLQFQNEESVHQLVRSCYRVSSNNCVGYFTRISSLIYEDKEVQVRPWDILDSEIIIDAVNFNERNTIFVGGVPRPLTASQLADVMSTLFGPVCAATIETDSELGYPKGSAGVTFRHRASKIAAICARFVQLNIDGIDKRVEIKPFVLRDQPCGRCSGLCFTDKIAQYFCPNIACLEYLCQTCWATVHSKASSAFNFHKPLLQKSTVIENEKLNRPWQTQPLSPFAQRLNAQRKPKLVHE